MGMEFNLASGLGSEALWTRGTEAIGFLSQRVCESFVNRPFIVEYIQESQRQSIIDRDTLQIDAMWSLLLLLGIIMPLSTARWSVTQPLDDMDSSPLALVSRPPNTHEYVLSVRASLSLLYPQSNRQLKIANFYRCNYDHQRTFKTDIDTVNIQNRERSFWTADTLKTESRKWHGLVTKGCVFL